jgi:tRNA-dihydrouridine synthase
VRIVRAMTRAVTILVTVKMRAGWDEREVNAPELARMMEDAGASAVAVHGRTAAQSYSGSSDWDLIARVAAGVRIPVVGSGDCVEAGQMIERLRRGIGGVLVGRGAAQPVIFRQAADRRAGRPSLLSQLATGAVSCSTTRHAPQRARQRADGFRHSAGPRLSRAARRWVINKLGRWARGTEGP